MLTVNGSGTMLTARVRAKSCPSVRLFVASRRPERCGSGTEVYTVVDFIPKLFNSHKLKKELGEFLSGLSFDHFR